MWWRGLARARLRLDDEALLDFGRVLGQQPKFFDARIERCTIFSRREDHTAAKREMDLAKDAQDAYIQLARADYYLACHAVEEAKAAADMTIRLEPANSAGWLALAHARYRLNQRDDAIDDARRARDLGAQDSLIDQLLATGED